MASPSAGPGLQHVAPPLQSDLADQRLARRGGDARGIAHESGERDQVAARRARGETSGQVAVERVGAGRVLDRGVVSKLAIARLRHSATTSFNRNEAGAHVAPFRQQHVERAGSGARAHWLEPDARLGKELTHFC